MEHAPKDGPKILIFDIETAPILAHVWRLFDENVGLNQIERDWCVIAWAAKWLGSKTVMYMDQRDAKNIEEDKPILEKIWSLLDEADIVITQNGKQFDSKKLNARFILNKMQPPSDYRHIDTKILAKRNFGFTSNKLEYMTEKLCTKYKKLTHKKFPGFELWKECLKGNLNAWKEMEKYNKHDVLSLEELYTKIIPWDSSINFNVYNGDDAEIVCTCGCKDFRRWGHAYQNGAKYQRFRCKSCGKHTRSSKNLISHARKVELHKKC